MSTGSFTKEFAEGKRWKVDEGLWAAIQAVLPAPGCRVIDLGAGIGRYVDLLRLAGYKAEGLDGIPGIADLSGGLVNEADLTSPNLFAALYSGWRETFGIDWAPDVGMFIEVGEHVPREKASDLLDNVADSASQRLIVSWAVPGQRGKDHIHCQTPEWVACEFGRRGWYLNAALTKTAREKAGKGWNQKLLVLTSKVAQTGE